MGLIFDENYLELEDFYAFVLHDVGADKLKPQLPLAAPPSASWSRPTPFAAHHDVDPDRLVEVIRHCDQRFNLGLNPVWLGQVHMYFKGAARLHGLQPRLGLAHPHARAYLQHLRAQRHGGPLRHGPPVFLAQLSYDAAAKPGDLRTFWREAEFVRATMRQCNHFCGISHSVRREDQHRRLAPAADPLPHPGGARAPHRPAHSHPCRPASRLSSRAPRRAARPKPSCASACTAASVPPPAPPTSCWATSWTARAAAST